MMKRIGTLFVFCMICFSLGSMAHAQDEFDVLIAYFSLKGNTSGTKNVDASSSASIVIRDDDRVGTTEYIADIIWENVGGDKVLVRTVEPYPASFDAVVDRNHEEAVGRILPSIQNSGINMEQYDVVFIGYPIWNMTIPQAIRTFLSMYDFSGKTVIPFCTHNGYGSGRSYADISDACPESSILEGIAIDASEVLISESDIIAWIERVSQQAGVNHVANMR